MLAELFDRVGVRHVWCIDDAYVSRPSLEDIAHAISADQLKDGLLTSVSSLNSVGAYRLTQEGVDRVEVLDRLAASVRAEHLDEHELDVLRSGIPGVPEDWQALGELRHRVTAAGAVFHPLRPADWSTESAEIDDDGAGHLFLVDEQLGDFRVRGLRLVEEIAQDHSAARIAILTNTGTGDAVQDWRQRVSLDIDDPERIGWVPKGDISQGERALARALRNVFTLPELTRLRGAVVAHHEKALEEAAESLRELDAQDLHEAFFSSQLGEGSDETEVMSTLLRRQIEIRAAQLQWEDSELSRTSGHLREVASGVSLEARAATPALVTLQRQALYDMGQHVSASSLPLLPGDIFSVLDDEQWWNEDPVHLGPASHLFVVVGQACDLAVRDDGARKDEPASVDAVAVRAWDRSSPPVLGQQSPRGQLRFGLPYFFDDGSHAYALLSPHTLPSLGVDLAVLNPTGRAIAVSKAELSPWVLPSWRCRYERLSEGQVHDKTNVLRRLYLLPQTTRTAIRRSLAGPSPESVKIALRGGALGFNLARVGRLASHVANALVSAVRAAQSRPAFERPLIDPDVPLEVEMAETGSG